MSLLDTVEPCPFCGKRPDMSDPDTLYPSGIYWREDKELGLRTYHLKSEYKEGDEPCYVMHCSEQAGGCGAEMNGDSKEETLAKWNTRPKVESLLSQCRKEARKEALLEAAEVCEVKADAHGWNYDLPSVGRELGAEFRRMAEGETK